jgi:cobalamin biosynthesis protein CobT
MPEQSLAGKGELSDTGSGAPASAGPRKPVPRIVKSSSFSAQANEDEFFIVGRHRKQHARHLKSASGAMDINTDTAIDKEDEHQEAQPEEDKEIEQDKGKAEEGQRAVEAGEDDEEVEDDDAAEDDDEAEHNDTAKDNAATEEEEQQKDKQRKSERHKKGAKSKKGLGLLKMSAVSLHT